MAGMSGRRVKGFAIMLGPLGRMPAIVRRHLTALYSVQDPRLEVLPCMHSGTYADDCICERIRQHKCYIVATCDRDLRRRVRKVSCILDLFGIELLLSPTATKLCLFVNSLK